LTFYSNTISCDDSIHLDFDIDTLNPDYFSKYYTDERDNFSDSTILTGEIISSIKFADLDTNYDYEYINTTIPTLNIYTKKDTTTAHGVNLNIAKIYYDETRKPVPVASLTAEIDFFAQSLIFPGISFSEFKTKMKCEDGHYKIDELQSENLLRDAAVSMEFSPYSPDPGISIDFSLEPLDFEDLNTALQQPALLTGEVNCSVRVSGEGGNWDELSETLSGNINIGGEDLILYGSDLDQLIKRVNRSQHFTLKDLGGVLVAGPFGLLVTKGSDFTSIMASNMDDTTEIVKIVSNCKLDKGNMMLEDVAFATTQNRIAMLGGYELHSDTIGIVIAVVDEQGKVKLHQSITGTGSDPVLSDIRPIKYLMKIGKNLLDGVLFIKGDIVYEGVVEHPVKK